MFGWLKRIRRNDPVFGPMLYMGDKLGYWEGRSHFAPADIDIEVFVEARSDDDMAQQHEFFATVVRRWPEISAGIVPALRSAGLDVTDDELSLGSFSIPKTNWFDDAGWEITFEAGDLGICYAVQMRGSEILSVSWDT